MISQGSAETSAAVGESAGSAQQGHVLPRQRPSVSMGGASRFGVGSDTDEIDEGRPISEEGDLEGDLGLRGDLEGDLGLGGDLEAEMGSDLRMGPRGRVHRVQQDVSAAAIGLGGRNGGGGRQGTSGGGRAVVLELRIQAKREIVGPADLATGSGGGVVEGGFEAGGEVDLAAGAVGGSGRDQRQQRQQQQEQQQQQQRGGKAGVDASSEAVAATKVVVAVDILRACGLQAAVQVCGCGCGCGCGCVCAFACVERYLCTSTYIEILDFSALLEG